MKGALMVCGTASDVGKSHVVTALCRLLARRGVRVAPFKAQNMALNSFVTASGHEIGRAQAVQAWASGVEPEVGMNPILLKPTGERTSQVVVMGRPASLRGSNGEVGHLDAVAYQAAKPRLRVTVLEALAGLRSRFDVVVLEGAGSAAEVNLLADDIVNLRLAAAAKVPAIVVGDIDRGGVFAALYGTVALLPDDLRPLVRAFVINKLRGDPALLGDGLVELERRCGVPTLGVLPWIHDIGLDAEDSLALAGRRPTAVEPPLAATLDVAAVRLPRIANFTDLDALATEPGVGVRMVEHASALGDPDLVVLPGTKATVADLEWLRGRGLDRALEEARKRGTVTVGICGGYQMLGQVIVDGVESGRGRVAGLGWLDAITVFRAAKLTRQRRGRAIGLSLRSGTQPALRSGTQPALRSGTQPALRSGTQPALRSGTQPALRSGTQPALRSGTQPALRSGTQPRVTGYEIHHGRVTRGGGARPWLRLDDTYGIEDEGAVDSEAEGEGAGAVFATSLHGLFEEDGFRGAFLADVARRRGKEFVPVGRSFAQARERQIDCLADMVDAHLDMAAIDALIKEGSPP